MTGKELHILCSEVVEISRKVGRFLHAERKLFKSGDIEHKGSNDLVSYVDKAAEEQFVNALKTLMPGAGFIAEEGTGELSESGVNWIIDPLDGTTNYVHNIPFYCTSVALVENKKPLLGVIYDPSHDEMFSAVKSQKSQLNGKAIDVSNVKDFRNMLMVTGFPYDSKGLLKSNLNVIGALTEKSRGIRRLGSAALDMCYVACSRFDGFYEYGLNAWDVAAGTCIVQQAGGVVNDFEESGNPLFSSSIIAGSSMAYKALLAEVQNQFKTLES